MQRAGHNRVGRGKLPAFTILELTVVMFLTGIVMASAYMAWTIVAQQFLGYQNTSNLRPRSRPSANAKTNDAPM